MNSTIKNWVLVMWMCIFVGALSTCDGNSKCPEVKVAGHTNKLYSVGCRVEKYYEEKVNEKR